MKKATETVLRTHIRFQRPVFCQSLVIMNFCLAAYILLSFVLNLFGLLIVAGLGLGYLAIKRDNERYDKVMTKIDKSLPLIKSFKDKAGKYSLIPLIAFFIIVFMFSHLPFMSVFVFLFIGTAVYWDKSNSYYASHNDRMMSFLLEDLKTELPLPVKNINTDKRVLISEAEDLAAVGLKEFKKEGYVVQSHFNVSGINGSGNLFEIMNFKSVKANKIADEPAALIGTVPRDVLIKDGFQGYGLILKDEHSYQINESILIKADESKSLFNLLKEKLVKPKLSPLEQAAQDSDPKLLKKIDIEGEDNLSKDVIPVEELKRFAEKFEDKSLGVVKLVITPKYLYWIIEPKDESLELLAKGIFVLSDFDILDKIENRRNTIARVLTLMV